MSAENLVIDARILAWLSKIDTLSGRAAASAGPADPTAERDAARTLSDALFAEFGDLDTAGVDKRTLHVPGGASLRIDEYRSRDAEPTTPAYLLLHGGAFRLGSIDEQINVAFCTQRARASGYTVYSLEYRLAPEHPFPAALDDARRTLAWLAGDAARLRVDPARIVVGGVSAGGNIAAALCLDDRDSGTPVVRGQLLEVPAVDLRAPGTWLDEYAAVNGFSTAAELRRAYGPSDAEALSPLVSPLLADLHGLPPTHVMTSEYDPLREAGEQFVLRLREAGNDVSASRHLGQLHGTQGLTAEMRAARLWHAEVVSVLREFAR